MNYIRHQVETFRMAALALTVLALFFAGAVRPAQSQTFTSLYTFPGPNGTPPGAYPNGLVQGTNGFLYGTGASNNGGVFKVSTSGVVTALHSFDAGPGDTDGEASYATLVPATNGNFYGTSQGNSGGCGGPNGTCGVVYIITPGGAFTVLYDFCAVTGGPYNCQDGTTTEVALVQASNGDFYGTNQVYGGYNAGTIFKVTPGGALTTLHSFCANGSYEDCPDGNGPYSPLVQGADGNLYGTTSFGGANYFDGTAFRITPGGTFTTLHSFSADGDLGYYPTGLIQAANGNFYGVTAEGGTTGGGTFFTMTTSGTVTTLYSFCTVGSCMDGTRPNSVILATDGNFYGTTAGGGVNSLGTIFQVTPSGTLTTVHSFNGADGASGSLMQDTNGRFYGTSPSGGAGYPNCNDCAGTVWSLSMGLGAFVETLPTSGRVGTAIKILGTNLKTATAVTFNGKAATFKVVSNSEITATVPTVATTGIVKVTTSKGTFKSNVVFTVP